jgi:hypothetical protein
MIAPSRSEIQPYRFRSADDAQPSHPPVSPQCSRLLSPAWISAGRQSGFSLVDPGEIVDAGAELGHPGALLLPAVGLTPAVLLELAAVVLDPFIRPGAELVGVAGALLGDLRSAPHISSLGSRRGRGAGSRLGPVASLGPARGRPLTRTAGTAPPPVPTRRTIRGAGRRTPRRGLPRREKLAARGCPSSASVELCASPSSQLRKGIRVLTIRPQKGPRVCRSGLNRRPARFVLKV